MIYLVISILCSVSVGVLFKFIKAQTSINIFLIAINYACAIAASYISFRHSGNLLVMIKDVNVIALSILLPLVFVLLTLSIKHSGIIKTDIAQRISLIIPIACSWWIFHESISLLKWMGIAAGFLAMLLILNKGKMTKGFHAGYLFMVFIGYGIIDVLFKQVALQKAVPYTTALFYIFCGSFIVSGAMIAISSLKVKISVDRKAVFYGLILGFFNFLNIYFYLKAHQFYAQNPTTVFATMNFGVILLGTLVGAAYFREKLSVKNILGLVLAVIAIGLVVMSQLTK